MSHPKKDVPYRMRHFHFTYCIIITAEYSRFSICVSAVLSRFAAFIGCFFPRFVTAGMFSGGKVMKKMSSAAAAP